MSFHAFGQCSQLFIDTALQKNRNYDKNLSLSFPENRIEKLLLVCFLLPFLFRQMVEKLRGLFGPHRIISAYAQNYELKLTFPKFHYETEAKVDFPSACI